MLKLWLVWLRAPQNTLWKGRENPKNLPWWRAECSSFSPFTYLSPGSWCTWVLFVCFKSKTSCLPEALVGSPAPNPSWPQTGPGICNAFAGSSDCAAWHGTVNLRHCRTASSVSLFSSPVSASGLESMAFLLLSWSLCLSYVSLWLLPL